VSGVTLNPDLRDSDFSFTPPQEYHVTFDSTDKLVESHRKQRARWEAQQSD
jgi:hypothetical protein